MFGQTALGSKTLSDSANRMFRIEVEGMRQNREADELNYPIRSSGSIYITVPYSRMSDQGKANPKWKQRQPSKT
ncbi:MAG: phycobilisome linker polypeptide [Cyanobacteria bacterium SW_6_48_11]|nr:MAG: phycobilisome linker polypeptide [Cyanobacteria bacterium SW_6_48_11]